MCGRFAASADADQLIEFFEIDQVVGELPPSSYNIAPTDPIVAVLERQRPGGPTRVLTTVRWGLVPSWAKDPSGAARLINARVETISAKPSFRRALASRRCLIPADGYYEWRERPRLGGGRPVKQPYFIRPKAAGPLAMAGLYEFWKAPDASWLTSATIITCAATDELGRLHDRMPMAVPRANWDAWLDPQLESAAVELLSVPAPDLELFAVSTAVNRTGNNGPELIVRLPGVE